MNRFNPRAIIELQNTLSSKNIERLKAEFIKRNFNKEDPPQNIDSEKGILYYYDSFKDNITSKKFEDALERILWQITNNLKNEIDLSNTYLNSKEKIKYWPSILEAFNYREKNNQIVFNLFPVGYKPKETIVEYLSNKFQFNPISQFEEAQFHNILKY